MLTNVFVTTKFQRVEIFHGEYDNWSRQTISLPNSDFKFAASIAVDMAQTLFVGCVDCLGKSGVVYVYTYEFHVKRWGITQEILCANANDFGKYPLIVHNDVFMTRTSLGLVIYKKNADGTFSLEQTLISPSSHIITYDMSLNTIVLVVENESVDSHDLLFYHRDWTSTLWSNQQVFSAPSNLGRDTIGYISLRGNTLYISSSIMLSQFEITYFTKKRSPISSNVRTLNNKTDGHYAEAQQSFSYFQSSSPWLLVLVTVGTLFLLVVGMVMIIHPYSRTTSSPTISVPP